MVAATIGVLTHLQWSQADDVRRAWGATTPVLVAIHDLRAGDPLDTTTVEVRTLPQVAIPGRVVERLAPGQRAVRSVGAGEVLGPDDVTTVPAGPLAARLPAGHTGVGVTLTDDSPSIGPGDVVDVVVVDTSTGPDGSGGRTPPRVAASGALVLDVHDDGVTLAVADDQAAGLAQQALVGPVGLTVRRPGPGP